MHSKRHWFEELFKIAWIIVIFNLQILYVTLDHKTSNKAPFFRKLDICIIWKLNK